MKASIVVASALAAFAVTGCSSEPANLGFGEPLRVIGGTFKSGALPGTPPLDGGTPVAPDVTAINSVNNILFPGQASKSLSGLVTDDASAVAVRFPDYGTGYWLVVPGVADPSSPGTFTWAMNLDIAYDVPPGLTTLRFAAVDANGVAGTQKDQVVCVTGAVPDNYNACDPTIAPPAAVVSLSWDTPVDLDLVIVTPSGQVVDPKHGSTASLADGGVAPNPKTDGVFDRDSDANCVPDHENREDLVWQGAPEPGAYLAYANLFSACGQQAARFTLSLNVAEPTGDGGTYALVEKSRTSGEVLAGAANGGAAKGLYVTTFSFPFQ